MGVVERERAMVKAGLDQEDSTEWARGGTE